MSMEGWHPVRRAFQQCYHFVYSRQYLRSLTQVIAASAMWRNNQQDLGSLASGDSDFRSRRYVRGSGSRWTTTRGQLPDGICSRRATGKLLFSTRPGGAAQSMLQHGASHRNRLANPETQRGRRAAGWVAVDAWSRGPAASQCAIRLRRVLEIGRTGPPWCLSSGRLNVLQDRSLLSSLTPCSAAQGRLAGLPTGIQYSTTLLSLPSSPLCRSLENQRER